MRYLKQILPIVCLMVGLYACHKDFSGSVDPNSVKSSSSAHPLTLSDSTAALGQPVVASIPTGLTSNNASWSVRPATGTQVTSAGQSATITFSKPGTYTIVAHYIVDSTSGTQDSCTAPITISDSNYTPPPVDTITLAGEKLTIIPTSVDTGGVTFLVETADSYACTYHMVLQPGAAPYSFSDSVTLAWLATGGATGCSGTNGPIVGSFTSQPLTVGTTQTISFFMPAQEGVFLFSVTETATGYTFSPISGGDGLVTISPTTLPN